MDDKIAAAQRPGEEGRYLFRPYDVAPRVAFARKMAEETR